MPRQSPCERKRKKEGQGQGEQNKRVHPSELFFQTQITYGYVPRVAMCDVRCATSLAGCNQSEDLNNPERKTMKGRVATRWREDQDKWLPWALTRPRLRFGVTGGRKTTGGTRLDAERSNDDVVEWLREMPREMRALGDSCARPRERRRRRKERAAVSRAGKMGLQAPPLRVR